MTEEKIYQIYCITNTINNKKYIGFTGRSIEYRLSCHVCAAHKGNSRIHKAIRKYAKENFQIEALCVSKDRDYTLNTLEPLFIKQFKTIERGYNIMIGGSGISYHTEETKKLMSDIFKNRIRLGWQSPSKGKKRSSETRKRISDKLKFLNKSGMLKKRTYTPEQRLKMSIKFSGINNPFYGKKHKSVTFDNKPPRTKETKDKLSNTWKITNPEGVVVILKNLRQFCKNASKERNIKLSPGTLRMVSIGKRTHHKNFKCEVVSKGSNSHEEETINLS